MISKELQDKIAIVTGGSRGIGYTVAKRFLENGATVVIVARSSHELSEAKSKLLGISPSIHTYSMDISKSCEVNRFYEWFEEIALRLDILVNCAGIQGPIGRSWEVDVEEWLYNLEVNLFGTYLMIRKALPIMLRRNYGKIINFSGGGATSPRPNFSAYAVSKTAVVRLTEIIAHELADYNICVNAIAPGAVNTRMLDEVLEAGENAGKKEFEEACKRKKAGGTSPEAAADLALFLGSEESDGITGRLISAVWDDWRSFTQAKEIIEGSALYTLRRIDNTYFYESTGFQRDRK